MQLAQFQHYHTAYTHNSRLPVLASYLQRTPEGVGFALLSENRPKFLSRTAIMLSSVWSKPNAKISTLMRKWENHRGKNDRAIPPRLTMLFQSLDCEKNQAERPDRALVYTRHSHSQL